MPKHIVSGAKLRRLLRYFRKQERVRIFYQYNDSLERHESRTREGKLQYYRVVPEIVEDDPRVHLGYDVFFTIDDREYQEYVPAGAAFNGQFSLQWSNSGPRCYFGGRILEWEKGRRSQ
jgi:hypothetical protein